MDFAGQEDATAIDMTDTYNLERFVSAQGSNIEAILNELRHGKKRGHWMWYIFPQLAGLGLSPTSQKYAIANKAEAGLYLNHPVLGNRLIRCTEAVIAHSDLKAEEIFGYPDCLKFRSSMTLFNEVSKATQIFQQALNQFYSGKTDTRSLEILSHL